MKDQISEAMKAAMKAGDKLRTSVLRMLLADIGYAELAGLEAMDGVLAYGKKLEKAIEEMRRVGRSEEAAKTEAELAIVREYLPARLTDDEVERIVDQTIAAENLAGPKDMGRGMKIIMSAHGKQLDGKTVQELLKKKLSGA